MVHLELGGAANVREQTRGVNRIGDDLSYPCQDKKVSSIEIDLYRFGALDVPCWGHSCDRSWLPQQASRTGESLAALRLLISIRTYSQFWPATASVVMGPIPRCARPACGSIWRNRHSRSVQAIPTPSFPGIRRRANWSSGSNPRPAPPDAADCAGRSQADEARGDCHPEGVDQGRRGLPAALGLRSAHSTGVANDGAERRGRKRR